MHRKLEDKRLKKEEELKKLRERHDEKRQEAEKKPTEEKRSETKASKPTNDEHFQKWKKVWEREEDPFDETEFTEMHAHIKPAAPDLTIDLERFERAIATQKGNWKTIGRDRIHLFFLKHIKSLHGELHTAVNKALVLGEGLPDFLSNGETLLLPKNDITVKTTKDFRPITLICTTAKLVSRIANDALVSTLLGNGSWCEQ